MFTDPYILESILFDLLSPRTKIELLGTIYVTSTFVSFTAIFANLINVPLLYISPSLILISSPSKPTTLLIKAVSIVNC